MRRGPFNLFFFCLFTFQNDRNLFWVYQNREFSNGKKHFTLGKKSGKMTLPSLKNIPVMPLCQSLKPTSSVKLQPFSGSFL